MLKFIGIDDIQGLIMLKSEWMARRVLNLNLTKSFCLNGLVLVVAWCSSLMAPPSFSLARCEAVPFFPLVGLDQICSLTTPVKKVGCVGLLSAVTDLLGTVRMSLMTCTLFWTDRWLHLLQAWHLRSWAMCSRECD